MKAAPRVTARRAGALYLISGVPAGFSVFVLMKLVVRGDPAATAANILGSESLFRLGFVADQVGIIFFLGSVLMLYELFRPVSRSLSLLMAWFGVIGAAIQAFNCLGDITALLFLKGGSITTAFTTAQSQALAFQFLKLHTYIYDLALVFYGVFAILIGYLVLKSTFLPRALGVFMAIDGLGYLTFSFSTFLSPPLVAHLHPFLPFVTALLGEGSLMLWLIVKTVNAQRWEEQAREAEASMRT
jgi:hypothetical protein